MRWGRCSGQGCGWWVDNWRSPRCRLGSRLVLFQRGKNSRSQPPNITSMMLRKGQGPLRAASPPPSIVTAVENGPLRSLEHRTANGSVLLPCQPRDSGNLNQAPRAMTTPSPSIPASRPEHWLASCLSPRSAQSSRRPWRPTSADAATERRSGALAGPAGATMRRASGAGLCHWDFAH